MFEVGPDSARLLLMDDQVQVMVNVNSCRYVFVFKLEPLVVYRFKNAIILFYMSLDLLIYVF